MPLAEAAHTSLSIPGPRPHQDDSAPVVPVEAFRDCSAACVYLDCLHFIGADELLDSTIFLRIVEPEERGLVQIERRPTARMPARAHCRAAIPAHGDDSLPGVILH